MDMPTIVKGTPVPFADLLTAEAKLNEVAQALRAEAKRVYEASRTIPKGPKPKPLLHVEIDLLQGRPQANGVRHAKYSSGSPPRILVDVEGPSGAYDRLNEVELVSFWDNVLYELQNARYDAAIRKEKNATDPVAFGKGRAEREAYATVFHLRSLGLLLSQASDALAFASALGLSARRAIKFADYPGDKTELERRFTSTPHRADARPGTRYALSSADMYAYEWLIDQQAGRVARFIVGTAFSDERWTGLEDVVVPPVDEELERQWRSVGDLPWKKPKLFFDVAGWTIEQITRADGAIAMRIGGHWNGVSKQRYPTTADGARAAVDYGKQLGVPGKLALAGRLPASLAEVAAEEFKANADPTVGGPPEEVTLQQEDITRFLKMVDGLKGLPEPV